MLKNIKKKKIPNNLTKDKSKITLYCGLHYNLCYCYNGATTTEFS